MSDNEIDGKVGWTKMYLKGVPDALVGLPVRGETAEEMAESVRKLLEYFQPTNPGLEPGQMKTMIVGCVRFNQESDRSGQTPAVHLYREYFGKEGTEFKTETVYFDQKYPQRLAAFEKVSGLVYVMMPVWVGEAPPSWKARKEVLDQYMIRPKTPFAIVQKPNPKHEAEPDEALKKKIKSRLFVGFIDTETGEVIGGYDDAMDLKAPATEPPPTPAPQPPKGEDTFAQSRGAAKSAKPAAKPADEEVRTFNCVRIDRALRNDGKNPVMRFYAKHDDPVWDAVAFTREPLKEAIGEKNDDFFFTNVAGKPWYDALKENGSYYPSHVLLITATKHSGVKNEGKKDEESFVYWTVASVTLTGEPNVIPDIPF